MKAIFLKSGLLKNIPKIWKQYEYNMGSNLIFPEDTN